MIAFKDFVPQQIKQGGFFTMGQYAPIDQAVQAANDWIGKESAHVLNIETILLPNMNNSGEEGTGDALVRTSGDMASFWHQFVRVWYTQE